MVVRPFIHSTISIFVSKYCSSLQFVLLLLFFFLCFFFFLKSLLLSLMVVVPVCCCYACCSPYQDKLFKVAFISHSQHFTSEYLLIDFVLKIRLIYNHFSRLQNKDINICHCHCWIFDIFLRIIPLGIIGYK